MLITWVRGSRERLLGLAPRSLRRILPIDVSAYAVLLVSVVIAYLAVISWGWSSSDPAPERARLLAGELHGAIMRGEPFDKIDLDSHEYLSIHQRAGSLYLGSPPQGGSLRTIEREAELIVNDSLAVRPSVFRKDWPDGWGVWAIRCSRQNVCSHVVVGSRWQGFPAYAGGRLQHPFALVLLLPLFALSVEARVRFRIARSIRTINDQVSKVGTGEARVIRANKPDLPEIGQLVSSMNDAIGRFEVALGHETRALVETAHDLRSPLSAARVMIELAVTQQSSDQLRDCIEEINRASTMIDGILLMSRGGSIGTQRSTVDVAAVVAKAISATERRFRDVNIERFLQPVECMLAPKALDSIIFNLLENASKYSRGQVWVTLAESDSSLQLVVEDNGAGIDTDSLETAVSPFGRLQLPGELVDLPGDGLGLSIVREGVRLQKGMLRVERSELGGCRFVVVLPMDLN